MDYTYSYPKVTGGYRWNILQRCLNEVGIEPIGLSDVGDQTVLVFSRALTAGEKTTLDSVMASDPCNPPATGVRALIRDLWEERVGFLNACGLPDLRIYYVESVPGSGKVDRIVLWHPTPLTTQQKNSVKTAYNNLWIG